MSDKYTFNKHKDIAEYERIVSNSKQGTIFSNTSFLNALNIKYEIWNVMLGSQIKAVICLTLSKDKKKVILSDKIIYGGIIFNTDFSRIETKRRSEEFNITEFLIKKLTRKFKSIEIQFSPEFKDIRPFQWFNYNNKNKKGFLIENRFTSLISLNEKNLDNFLETEVYKNMETVRRYDYRAAIKEKAKLTISKDLSVFIEFYKNLFSKQKKVSKKYLIELQKELNNIVKIGKGLMFHVEDKIGNILYTFFYILEKDKAFYYLGAGNPKISKSWQSVFGHCEIFKYLNKKYDINQVDLEGVNSPFRGWFKLSLGGNLTQYYKVKI
ncbi:MAG: hypothetical protein CBC25_01005 [Pelagibacteraceae bacterium TMED65]|nr:MAG: hypothetical protein CBC25_01005 [Pelagibacteraceae bacterium TMED65]